MTDQEINIAIAEACGWEWWHCPTSGIEIDRLGQLLKLNGKEWKGWVKGKCPRAPKEDWHLTYPPDFLNDRNAIHDALSTLTEDQWYQFYYEVLPSVVRPGGSCQNLQLFRATIKQIAEAFLRTIGKWRNG